MSGQYKDGKKIVPKPKAPKRKSVHESVNEQTIALLLQKRNLIQENIADDFLNPAIREAMVSERVKKLKNLNPNELLTRLAKTEIHLETVLFLYDETFEQKKFLEEKYRQSGEVRLIQAANKAAGKAKVQGKYSQIKEVARQILSEMKVPNYGLLRRKLRARFSVNEVSDNTLSNYFKEISGRTSTK